MKQFRNFKVANRWFRRFGAGTSCGVRIWTNDRINKCRYLDYVILYRVPALG